MGSINNIVQKLAVSANMELNTTIFTYLKSRGKGGKGWNMYSSPNQFETTNFNGGIYETVESQLTTYASENEIDIQKPTTDEKQDLAYQTLRIMGDMITDCYDTEESNKVRGVPEKAVGLTDKADILSRARNELFNYLKKNNYLGDTSVRTDELSSSGHKDIWAQQSQQRIT
ncbi:MAG: hypothetical protein HOK80_05380 [Candidatus Cloacimonetes bacterium]|jgi:hypothetical protein|nr:hypothetical protein [Candidatus Cloacimonadota bacterium]